MIGLVTIGQSPRNDVVKSMFEIPPPVLIQSGALDDLAPQRIEDLRPSGSEPMLVSVLRDGSEVKLSKRSLTPHLERAILRVEQQGAQTICVLCTGRFGELKSKSRLVFPDQLISSVVEVLLPGGVLGLLIPDSRQKNQMMTKWSTPSRKVLLQTASPYADTHRIGYAAERLQEDGAELVLMDCMGYTRTMRHDAQQLVDVPVVLSNALVGSILLQFNPIR